MSRWKRMQRYFRQQPEVGYLFLVGVALILLGAVFALVGWGYRATISAGVGGSLLAAAVVVFVSPLNDEAFQDFRRLGIKEIRFNRKKIESDQWCSWLRQARQQCTLLGTAHHGWCEDPDFPKVLADRLQHGVAIKIFFLHPGSEVAAQRNREEQRAARSTIRAIQESIRFVWEFRETLHAAEKERLKLYVYNTTPSCGTLWIDSFMIVTHYLAGIPCLRIEPVVFETGSRDLYDVYREKIHLPALIRKLRIAVLQAPTVLM